MAPKPNTPGLPTNYEFIYARAILQIRGCVTYINGYPMKNMSGRVIKGYELLEEIGAGGFGAVYRALQPAVGREVAIKIILPRFANNPDFIRRFEAEAQLIARLEHLHIVPLYDYWRSPDGAYLVMRFLRGGSARNILDEHGAWETRRVARLLDQISSALMVAHRKRIIHRDIKPDNILLDESDNYFLVDFGIAKDLEIADERPDNNQFISGSPAYLSPEQISGRASAPQTDVYGLGIVLFELLTGTHPFSGANTQGLVYKQLTQPIPSIGNLRPDLPLALDAVLQRATAKEIDDRYPDALALADAFRQAIRNLVDDTLPDTTTVLVERPEKVKTTRRGLLIDEPENPYKGLRAFRSADASDFFGRDKLVHQLIQCLDTTHTGSRFLAVVGPSGSGKSSVVHAGMLPALRDGALPGSESWFYLDMFPGQAPFAELETALLSIAINPPEHMLEQMRENERGLLRALKRTLPDDDSELLLVIDQFEEVFTLVKDESRRRQFLEALYATVSDPRSRMRVIVTLRADFYDRPLMYGEFGNLMRDNTEVVLPLSREELKLTITSPAARVGMVVESALVDAIVEDVSESNGALPLLQYALTELYERRTTNTLMLETYREIGGVSGALAQRAEELFLELAPNTQAAVEQIFLRLVTLGEGTEDTRRRATRSELLSIQTDHPQAIERALERYGKYRLLTFDNDPISREPTVEVAHEALIREWMRLRSWLDQSRDDLRTQRRLATTAIEWTEADHDASFLARGTQLMGYLQWQENTNLALSEIELGFIEASDDAHRQRLAEEEAQREREALLEQRSRNRLRAFLALAAVTAVVGIALSAIAFTQRAAAVENASVAATSAAIADNERALAERTAAEAQSLALAASAQQALGNSNTDLAIALALQAVRLEDPPAQAQRVLADAAYAPGTRQIFNGHTNFVLNTVFNPVGNQFVSASADGTMRLWDARTGETLRVFTGHSAAVNDVDFSSDGTLLVSTGADGTVRLWDIATGDQLATLRNQAGGLLSVDFSPDDRLAVVGSADGVVLLWDLQSDAFSQNLSGHDGPIYDVQFSPRGPTLISASGDGAMRLWNRADGSELRRFVGDDERLLSAALSPTGLIALSGSDDGTIRQWDMRFGQQLRRFFGHTDAVRALAFTPDSIHAVSASDDGTLRLWDIETSEELVRLRGHSGQVTSISIAPDGRTVVSGSTDNSLRLWDFRSGAETERILVEDEILTHIHVNEAGTFALAASQNGGLHTWDLQTGEQIRQLSTSKGTVSTLQTQLNEFITAVDLSDDGVLALSGSRGGEIIVWDVSSGTDLRRLNDHNSPITAATFMPDNETIFSAARNHSLIRTQAVSGEIVFRVDNFEDVVTTIAATADGADLLLGTDNGDLIVADSSNGEVRRRVSAHQETINDIAIHEQMVLTASDDGSIKLWDLNDEVTIERLRLEGHDDGVFGVAFSPDAAFAVSVSHDRSLILWDLRTGEAIQQLFGHTDDIYDVTYLPDGLSVLTASADHTLRQWSTRPLEQLVEWTEQNRYIPEFSCNQREQYRIEPLCEQDIPTQPPV